MRQFLTLLKLEFVNRSPRNREKGRLFVRILKSLFILLGVCLLAGVLIFACNSVIKVCVDANLEQEFVVYFVLLVQVIQFLFGLSLTTKTLYFNSDSDLLKLPLSGRMIFLAKITYLFIYEFIFTSIIALPVFILYGIATLQGWLFYVLLLPNLIFLPMIPFLFAILLSVPAMYVVSFLKTKFVVMLFLYILCVAVGFYVYVLALKFIMQILDGGNIEDVFSASVILSMKQITQYLHIPLLFKNSLLQYRFWQSVAINIFIVVALGIIIFSIAKKFYLKLLLSNIEGNNFAFEKKTKIKDRGLSRALFFREFVTIFRSVNYSFQYLTVIITTPLMVYFSSEIASSIGVAQIGEGILPGIAVLVLIMFLTMGTSFAATSITREGGNFFHTKIIPVSYKKQVTVKFLLYVIVSVPAIFISCLILALAGFLTYANAMIIAVAVSLIIIGNICSSISLDIKKPQFMYLDGKEITTSNKNITASISLGFVIAILMGVGSIVASLFLSLPSMYMVLFGFGIPFAFIEMFRLFFRLEKKYRAIEA